MQVGMKILKITLRAGGQIAPDDIGHIRPPKAKAALITFVLSELWALSTSRKPDSFQLLKMIFDAAVIGACLGVARLINIKINCGRARV